MSEGKTITHRSIMLAALILSVTALPFSLKICHAGMILLLAAWFFEGNWKTKARVINRSLLLQVTIVAVFIEMMGLLYSDHLITGWFTLEKKIFFLLVPIALATTTIQLSKSQIKLIVGCFILACFAATVICIFHAWHQADILVAGDPRIKQYLSSSSYSVLNPFQSEKWLIFSYVSLSEGINIHPTYFSLYVTFCITIMLHQVHATHSKNARIAMGALGLYFAVFVIFLASRIMIIGLAVILVIVLFRSIMDKRSHITYLMMVIGFFFSVILYINPVSRYRSLQEIQFSTFRIEPDNVYMNAAQIRVSLWWLAIQSLHPSNTVFGVGTGDVEKTMKQASAKFHITNILGSFDPHNQYLYTLLGNGIIGLIALILCFGIAAYLAWLQKDYLLLSLVFLFSLLCITETALELQKGVVFYTLFLSLFAYQYHSFQTVTINLKSILRAGN